MSPRALRAAAAIALLALFAWLGVRSVLDQPVADLPPGQRAALVLQWSYSALAALAIVGLLLGRAGTRYVLAAWAVTFTVRNVLTPIVWGGKGLVLGAVGGLVGLAVVVPVIYLAHGALERKPRLPPS